MVLNDRLFSIFPSLPICLPRGKPYPPLVSDQWHVVGEESCSDMGRAKWLLVYDITEERLP